MIGYVRRYLWSRTWTAVLRDGTILKRFALREQALARVEAQILALPSFVRRQERTRQREDEAVTEPCHCA